MKNKELLIKDSNKAFKVFESENKPFYNEYAEALEIIAKTFEAGINNSEIGNIFKVSVTVPNGFWHEKNLNDLEDARLKKTLVKRINNLTVPRIYKKNGKTRKSKITETLIDNDLLWVFVDFVWEYMKEGESNYQGIITNALQALKEYAEDLDEEMFNEWLAA